MIVVGSILKLELCVMLCQDFCCNGTVVEDLELGKIIQLQGDQRKNVSHFLVEVILSLSPFITKFVSA